MKAIVCEMCGSQEIVKQDGVYVCQHCGTKYSLEEARELMIAGTVDVKGTVKVDNSDFIQKSLQNARRAKQKEDWDEMEKYYNIVEQNDPTNIEAIFYSAYGKAKSSLVDGDLYKRQSAFNVLKKSVSIIDDNFDLEKEEENKEIIQQISSDIIKMSTSSYVYNERKNGYGDVTWTDKTETITLFNQLGLEFMKSLENIANKIPDSDKQKRIYYYKIALKHAEHTYRNGNLANPQSFLNIITTYHNWIRNLDPSHQIPVDYIRSQQSKIEKQEGCGKFALAFIIAMVIVGIFFAFIFSGF